MPAICRGLGVIQSIAGFWSVFRRSSYMRVSAMPRISSAISLRLSFAGLRLAPIDLGRGCFRIGCARHGCSFLQSTMPVTPNA